MWDTEAEVFCENAVLPPSVTWNPTKILTDRLVKPASDLYTTSFAFRPTLTQSDPPEAAANDNNATPIR